MPTCVRIRPMKHCFTAALVALIAAKAVELPTTFTNYWVNRQGRIVGTNDPSEDPNRGSTEQWSRMAPQKR
jgi:hypothetical protein